MYVKLLKLDDVWQEIKNATMSTIGKNKGVYPTPEWKRRLLISEHSPIRKLKISAKWFDLKSWVSVHFVRHKIGIEHWVSTQRDDRNTTVNQTHISRDSSPQSTLISHEIEANAQTMINISRKRLCNCASEETRQAWEAILNSIKDKEPELFSVCVPDCIYRGWCYEFNSCGFHKTEKYQQLLAEYRKGINE